MASTSENTLPAEPRPPESNPASTGQLANQLIGSWQLESFVETDLDSGTNSHPFGHSPLGNIIYTKEGLMSAHVQGEDRKPFKSADVFRGEPDEYMAAGRTYLAYSGTFSVDAATSRVFHDVTVSFFPNWVGLRQVRVIDITDDRLKFSFEKPIRSNGSLKSSTVIWRRLTA